MAVSRFVYSATLNCLNNYAKIICVHVHVHVHVIVHACTVGFRLYHFLCACIYTCTVYVCHVQFPLFVCFTEETDDEEDDYEEEEPGFKALVGRHDKREHRPFFLLCFVGVFVSIQYCILIMAHTMYMYM